MSSLASTKPARSAAAPRQAWRQPESGYFEHHGFWSPGIRLFRFLHFKSKALIVSTAFLVPISLLATKLWNSTQEVVGFATKERAGVAALRLMPPVYEKPVPTLPKPRTICPPAPCKRLRTWRKPRLRWRRFHRPSNTPLTTCVKRLLWHRAIHKPRHVAAQSLLEW